MRRTARRQNLRDSGNDGKAAGAGTLNGGTKGWGQGEDKNKNKNKNKSKSKN